MVQSNSSLHLGDGVLVDRIGKLAIWTRLWAGLGYGFSEGGGGGLTVMRSCMAMARGRMQEGGGAVCAEPGIICYCLQYTSYAGVS